MRLLLLLVVGFAAGCADAPDGPTLDGTAPAAPIERTDPDALVPDDSLRPAADLVPDAGLAPATDLAPESGLAP